MSEPPHSPLTPVIAKMLTDKLYEKRKAAALEIEKQTKDYVKSNNMMDLDRLIMVLQNYALSSNTSTRNGGLIGLAATAIALGKDCGPYTSRLMEPVFSCFTDSDSRVRYFACEALYNIVKICKAHSIEKFDGLFDILWKLSSDPDQNVRSGSELLDRLVKEIVVAQKEFDVDNFMLLVRERIYSATSLSRRFIISWLNEVLFVPSFSISHFIPEVVDGTFKALEDPSYSVREVTLLVLKEMLLKLDPKNSNEVDVDAVINLLVAQANSMVPICREISIIWLKQICDYYNEKSLQNLSSYLISVLPVLSDDTLKAKELNQLLMNLVRDDSKIPIDSVVEVLLAHLRNNQPECRIASLRWISHLHSTKHDELLFHIERFFPVLLELLSDDSDEVLMSDIMLVTDICNNKSKQQSDLKSLNLSDDICLELGSISPYLVKFSVSLIKMFKNDQKLMTDRGVQIIRQICLLLNPVDVYRSLAILLPSTFNGANLQTDSKDLDFIPKLVTILNRILLTTSELFLLRRLLKNPEQNDCVELFTSLYKCWSHQPICLLSLYITSQSYAPGVDLIKRFSEIDVTVDILTEIDRLVQLIESPILSYVRMDLLNPDTQRPLSTILSALLMLLPQTESFNVLNKRLQILPHISSFGSPRGSSKSTSTASTSSTSGAKIKFKELIQYFDRINQFHIQNARIRHKKMLETMIK